MADRIEDGGTAEAGLVERLAKGGHTPGPWGWFGNANSYSLYLATRHSGRRYVMSFRRWGMRGAQPEFQPERGGLVDASRLLEFEVGDRTVRGVEQAKANGSVYRYDVRGIDCPDARLIAAAPELLDLAIQQAAEITRLRAENAGMLEALKFYGDAWMCGTNKRYGGLEWKPKEALLDDCGN
ncbi:hypothetical protein OSH12_23955, partial [Kaistia terrae]